MCWQPAGRRTLTAHAPGVQENPHAGWSVSSRAVTHTLKFTLHSAAEIFWRAIGWRVGMHRCVGRLLPLLSMREYKHDDTEEARET